VQTPQGFYTEDLRRAYRLAKGEYADDSAVYAAFCRPPRLCAGGAENRKLTFAADFPPRYAVGEGFDCHAFAAGRKLVLGGVEIPHDRGLLGHSDADVLTHAVMDALLSGVGEGDIGVQFPDTDPAYRGISSMLLLERVMQIVARKGRRVESLSAVLMAEKPKLKNFLPAIAENLAAAVGIPYVGLSVTTLEGLGFVGREEGICARASALLRENG
jgi:ygbB family